MTQPSFNIVCTLRVAKAKKLRSTNPYLWFHEAQPFPKRYANRTYNRFLIDIRPFVLYHRTQEAFVHIKRQAVKSSPRNGVMRIDSINATLVLLIVLFYLISHKQK